MNEKLILDLIKALAGDGSSTDEGKEAKTGYEKYLNKNIFVRTVTHHYTGHVTNVDAMSITINSAAWIADDGRFNETIKSGDFDEVEPYVDPVTISLYSILDITTIPKLLTEVK